MDISQKSSSDFFESQWRTYKKVVDNNYMNHRQIYEVVSNFIINNFSQPFSILDLGCGDAHFIIQSLLNSSVNYYHGVDLSPDALNIAKKNLNRLTSQNTLTTENIISFVDNNYLVLKGKYDIVFSSFALHHLSLVEKENLISKIPSLLKKDGFFLWIDVVFLPDETREDYLKRYLKNISENWLLITHKEFNLLREHIINYDFPEEIKILENIMLKSGFVSTKCLYQDFMSNAFLCGKI